MKINETRFDIDKLKLAKQLLVKRHKFFGKIATDLDKVIEERDKLIKWLEDDIARIEKESQ